MSELHRTNGKQVVRGAVFLPCTIAPWWFALEAAVSLLCQRTEDWFFNMLGMKNEKVTDKHGEN